MTVVPATRRGRRRLLLITLVATSALTLAACGSSGSSSSSSGGSSSQPTGSATSGSITWWASPISTSGPDLRKALISDFEKAYPNITVNLQTAPTNTDTNEADLDTTISGGASASPTSLWVT